ncbi:MAG: NAD(P)-binding protein [Candidatus Altiarchaeota archaeon]
MKEIKILGAGVSGLTAAINISKAGFDVEVFEKEKDVGQRFSGDFQVIENWVHREDILDIIKKMNLDLDFSPKPLDNLMIFGPKGKKFVLTSKHKSGAYIVQRGPGKGSLDCCLKNQALKSGVKINFNSGVKPEDADIVATGPNIITCIASGINFSTNNQDTEAWIIDDEVVPKAYSYLVIRGGCGTIASVIMSNFNDQQKYMGGAVDKFKKYLDIELRDSKPFIGHGGFSVTAKKQLGGRLFVGEAGGFQDKLFGFGLRYAIESGYYAARSIIENRDYEDVLVKSELVDQQKSSVVNRFLYERLGNVGYRFLLNHWASRKDVEGYMRGWYTLPSWKKYSYRLISLLS